MSAFRYCGIHQCELATAEGEMSVLIVIFSVIFQQAQMRVLAQREEQALLQAYIVEWRKFFTQSGYLPLPFRQLESGLQVSVM